MNNEEKIIELLTEIRDSLKKKKLTKTNKSSQKFTIPTLDEVKEYIIDKSYQVDAVQFIDFYESKGWMVGKNKMKDWKACVRTWAKRDKPKENKVQKDWPPNFDPSRQCSSGESVEACKTRAWREHIRLN
jgi:hypothetical protein